MTLPDWKEIITVEGGTEAQRAQVVSNYDDFFSGKLGQDTLAGIIEHHGKLTFTIHPEQSSHAPNHLSQQMMQGLTMKGDIGSDYQPLKHNIDFYPVDFEKRQSVYYDENLQPQPYTKEMAQVHEMIHAGRGHNFNGTVYPQCTFLFEREAMQGTNQWLESKGMPKAALIYAGIDLRGANIENTDVCYDSVFNAPLPTGFSVKTAGRPR